MFNIREAGVQAEKEAKQIIKEMKSGKRETGIDWADQLADDYIGDDKTNLREMIGTDDGAAGFVEKTTYDLFSGREAVPLIYKPFYRTTTDSNFPRTLTMEEFGPVEVVFLQKYEGGEVKFGSLGPGTEKTVSFVTYAAGIEYDEDILEYNQTWRVSEINVAFGEAYNKLLNHIHLNPIISGSYTTTGGGLAAQKAAQEDSTSPIAQLVAWDTDLATTLRNALTVLPRGTLALANSADQFKIEDALAGAMLADTSPSVVKRQLRPENIVYYDGDEVTVGSKTYTYTGVTAGFMYLVVPGGRNLREMIKHDLRVDSNDGDLSRLILSQVVGRARRAVMVALGGKYGVIKVDIAS